MESVLLILQLNFILRVDLDYSFSPILGQSATASVLYSRSTNLKRFPFLIYTARFKSSRSLKLVGRSWYVALKKYFLPTMDNGNKSFLKMRNDCRNNSIHRFELHFLFLSSDLIEFSRKRSSGKSSISNNFWGSFQVHADVKTCFLLLEDRVDRVN